jgi:hypothetical protein
MHRLSWGSWNLGMGILSVAHQAEPDMMRILMGMMGILNL